MLDLPRSSSSRHSADTDPDNQQFILAWDADIERAARALALNAESGCADADDFAQEARLHLFTSSKASSHSEGYVRNIISNAIRTARRGELRYDSHRVSLDERSSILDMAAVSVAEGANTLAVRMWVEGLPLRLRAVYELLYVRGDDQRTAARTLGLSQPRIAALNKELLKRGRRDLQQ